MTPDHAETSDSDARDDLAGDDEDYGDVDGLEAIGLGILQELTLIRQTLQAQQAARDAAVTDDNTEWECDCGETLRSQAKAQDHAVQSHDAPREGPYWRRLYQEGDR